LHDGRHFAGRFVLSPLVMRGLDPRIHLKNSQDGGLPGKPGNDSQERSTRILGHEQEKCEAVFRKDHAQTKS
jgi:hypothetical protein